MTLRFAEVLHDCDTPKRDSVGLPDYDYERERGRRTIAKWRCPVCGQRWRYYAEFLDRGRCCWHRYGEPRWRWRRAERRRLSSGSHTVEDGS